MIMALCRGGPEDSELYETVSRRSLNLGALVCSCIISRLCKILLELVHDLFDRSVAADPQAGEQS